MRILVLSMLLVGGYSQRDRGEDRAPFVVETARPLGDLRASGQVGLSLRWRSPSAPPPDTLQAAAALCRAHPGPARRAAKVSPLVALSRQ